MKAIALSLFCGTAVSASVPWFTGPQELEFAGEALSASDITAQSYRLAYSGEEGPWSLDLGLGWSDYQIDYAPVLFGETARLHEETPQLDLALTHGWGSDWSASLRVRAYDGFPDYRSIWISEFYRQFFGNFSAYQSPDPHGHAFGASVTWNYLPGSGKAEWSVETGRDEIAPGWSFNPALGQPQADRGTLDTTSGSLRIEQAINGWTKTELAFHARQTSDRQPRLGVRHAWAAAAGPFGIRIGGGYGEEAPSFDAFHGDARVEWQVSPQWMLHAGYRIYEDTGEIEASGFNAQAPSLASSEVSAGLLWDRGDLAVGASFGFLDTDYEALSEDNRFFGNLYRDRGWWTIRFAASYRF